MKPLRSNANKYWIIGVLMVGGRRVKADKTQTNTGLGWWSPNWRCAANKQMDWSQARVSSLRSNHPTWTGVYQMRPCRRLTAVRLRTTASQEHMSTTMRTHLRRTSDSGQGQRKKRQRYSRETSAAGQLRLLMSSMAASQVQGYWVVRLLMTLRVWEILKLPMILCVRSWWWAACVRFSVFLTPTDLGEVQNINPRVCPNDCKSYVKTTCACIRYANAASRCHHSYLQMLELSRIHLQWELKIYYGYGHGNGLYGVMCREYCFLVDMARYCNGLYGVMSREYCFLVCDDSLVQLQICTGGA